MRRPLPSGSRAPLACRPTLAALVLAGVAALLALHVAALEEPDAGTARAAASALRFAGQIGGSPQDLALRPDRAWVAAGPRVLALQRPDGPGAPKQVAASEALSGVVRALALDGEDAILAGDGFGLARMRLRAEDGPPRVVEALSPGYDTRDVALSDGRAFVAARDGHVHAYDLRAPEGLLHLGSLSLEVLAGAGPLLVEAEGDRLWVVLETGGAPGQRGAIVTVDVSDPGAMRVLGRLDTEGVIAGLAPRDGLAFLAEEQVGLRVVDGRDPEALGTLALLPDAGRPNGLVSGIAIAGDRAWLVGYGAGAVSDVVGRAWRLDIADPAAPEATGSVELPYAGRAAAALGGRLWTAQPEGAVTIVDGGDPSDPVVSGTWRTPGVVQAADLSLAEDGSGRAFAWLAAGAGGSWSVALEPDAPPRALERVPASGASNDLRLDGGRAYVSIESGGIQILDAGNPERPKELGILPSLSRPMRVAPSTADGVALVADLGSGLVVTDVSSPAAPRILLGMRQPGFAWDVARRGDQAWVAAGDAGIALLDVSDLRLPRLVSTAPTGGSAWGVEPAGRHLLVADLDGGLAIFDAVDPRRPREIGRLPGGQAVDVAAADGFALVAKGEAGLQVVDVRIPWDPVPAGGIGLPGWTRSVAARPDGEGGYWILASAREAGLYLFRSEPPGLPTATPGPSVTPYLSPTPEPLPTRAPIESPTPTTDPRARQVFLPVVERSGSLKPDLPLRVSARLRLDELGAREALSMDVHEGHAYLGLVDEAGAGRLVTLDLGAAAGPEIRGEADLASIPYALDAAHGLARIAGWRAGLETADLRDPLAPRSLGLATLGMQPLYLAGRPDSETLLASGAPTDRPNGAEIRSLLVDAPPDVETGAPLALGAVGPLALAPDGAAAYASDYTVGLRVIDPRQDRPVEVRSLAAGNPAGVAAGLAGPSARPLALLAIQGDGWSIPGGVRIWDIASPLDPRPLGRWSQRDPDLGGRARMAAIDPRRAIAWLADGDSVFALGIGDPAQPFLRGVLRVSGPAEGAVGRAGDIRALAAGDDGRVYVLDRGYGFYVLQVGEALADTALRRESAR